MSSKILFNGLEAGNFIIDGESNYMGVEWLMNLDEAITSKIQDHVESNYLSSTNKIPASSINITTAQIS
jgi:hypothetical protein